MDSEQIAKYLKYMPKVLLSQFAPGVVEGALGEILKDVSVKKASRWVTDAVILWDKMDQKHREMFEVYGSHLGACDWFTSEYIINSVHKTNPALASLLLGWDDGYAWLEKQTEIIRSKVSEAVEHYGT